MRLTSIASLVLLTASLVSLPAADWPQWRGEKRDGHAPDFKVTTLPKELPRVWKKAIGPGFSSPIVAGDKVIYMEGLNGREWTRALRTSDGGELWSNSVAASEGDEWGSGPRCTPFVDGDRVYTQSMNGEFACLDLATGQVRWQFNFKGYGIEFSTKSAEGTAARRGNNGSGVVDGDYVFVPVGAKGASIVAFHKLTGKEVWKSGQDEAAYSSFVIATLAGTRQLVAFTAEALCGLNLQTGAELWRVPFKTGAKRHAATPVIAGDLVIVNSQTIGLVATKISRDGDRWLTSTAWANKSLPINLATPVLSGGHLYSYGAIRTKDYVCVDAATGLLKWKYDGMGLGKDQTDYASTIAVGSNLLVLTYDGQLLLLAASPERFTELGRVQVCGKTWCHPALANGRLYVRDGRELQCLDLSRN